VAARFEALLRRGVMQMIRRHDRDDVDFVRTRRFCLQHLVDAHIAAFRIEQQVSAALARSLRIGRKHAGNELVTIVETRGNTMHGADESAAAAADHPEAQTSSHFNPVSADTRS
jgi:hypothetical protein